MVPELGGSKLMAGKHLGEMISGAIPRVLAK